MLAYGTKVKTVKDTGSKDWSDPTRKDTKWGVQGEIVNHSDSHGLVYLIQHDCGGTGWYETAEIEQV